MRRERLPQPARVRRELDRIRYLSTALVRLSEELEGEYLDAYDAGFSAGTSKDGPATLGRNFTESDPTGNLATNGRLRSLRWRASKAATCLQTARALCEEAQSHLGMGMVLALDDDEWARWLEKKLAAEA